jgi:predicted nucleic acid-binding protein
LPLLIQAKSGATGLGYIDIHLLAAALINDLKIWTTDKALKKTAQKLNIYK